LATDYLVNKVRSGWVAYLGTESSAHYIERAGLSPVPISELVPDHSPKALVLLDDEGFDWYRDINSAINLVRNTNIPVVLANKDITYPANHTEVGVAIGGVAGLMEQALGRQFIRFGKPDPMVFAYAYAKAQSRDLTLQKRDVLMVGDTLTTDIIGANKFGIDSALVLSGTTSAATYSARIEATGIVPNYICDSILT
jgi:HAD superfamily hydrolase (TIGR01450 family)